MFLGTSRPWWIAAAVLFVGGLFLIVTDAGGTVGNILGVLLVFAAIAVFSGAPMRYGQSSRRPQAERTDQTPIAAADAPVISAAPPRARPSIEAVDPSEV